MMKLQHASPAQKTGLPMRPEWIAVDWGTTHLRAWAMRADGAVLDTTSSDAGMGALTREGFEPALLALAEPWLEPDRVTPVVACGMVGARQGWVEASYLQAPCSPVSPDLTAASVADSRISVHILPGVMQPEPADVMRGEETQIAGFLAHEPGYDGLLCLPGTHSKWARVRDEHIENFQTFLTGELFALLSRQSVLRHSMDGADWDDEAFLGGVDDALSAPERFAGQLFPLRAGGLVAGLYPGAARARLSGLLIGSELTAIRMSWMRFPVTIIGAGRLSALYAQALAAQSRPARQEDGDAMTLAGLAAAYALFKEHAR